MKHIKYLPEEGLVRLPSVLCHFQISRSGWYQGIKEGIYPSPIKVGNKSFWKANEIRELIKKISNTDEMKNDS